MRPLSFFFFFLTIPPPPRSTLFPYTTLFRSREESLESSNISRQENRRLSVTDDRDETARFRGARHPVRLPSSQPLVTGAPRSPAAIAEKLPRDRFALRGFFATLSRLHFPWRTCPAGRVADRRLWRRRFGRGAGAQHLRQQQDRANNPRHVEPT